MDRVEMFAKANLITKLVASSVTISRLACARIVETVGTDLQRITKEDKSDLQTKADRISQQIIVNSLKRKFGPQLTVIGEEDGLINDNFTDEIEPGHDALVLVEDSNCPEELKKVDIKDVTIWVDPLDGTSEFAEGLLDHVTVLIGIAVGSSPVAGVIAQPFFGFNKLSENINSEYGRTIWAIKGMGVHGIQATAAPPDQRIITTTRSHSSKLITDTIEAMKPDTVLRVGGAGHKVMLLMEGKAHAYVFASKGCKKWDTCAPEAVLTVLGGKLTDVFNDSLIYSKEVEKPNCRGILATAPGVDHQWFVDRIPESVKNSLL